MFQTDRNVRCGNNPKPFLSAVPKEMNVSIQETIGLFPCQMKTASSEPSEMFLSPTLTLSLDLRKNTCLEIQTQLLFLAMQVTSKNNQNWASWVCCKPFFNWLKVSTKGDFAVYFQRVQAVTIRCSCAQGTRHYMCANIPSVSFLSQTQFNALT